MQMQMQEEGGGEVTGDENPPRHVGAGQEEDKEEPAGKLRQPQDRSIAELHVHSTLC